jgi:hypothetical protein
MSIAAKDLKPGDRLYDCHRHKAGNTTISVDGVWECYVREVGEDERGPWALISWNGNRPEKHRSVKWKRWPKEWIVQGVFAEAECYMCGALKSKGHRETCEHPAADRARKRAAKEAAREIERRYRK